nr:hypothetical protein [Blastococcus atacamensis]
MLLSMPGDVQRGRVQKPGLVTEEAEPVVAPLAEQRSGLPAVVVVIEMLRLRVTADRTAIQLLRS